MDFRVQKLRWCLLIIGLGMAAGVGWACWQGAILGRGYPYNTILCYPPIRFGDFTSVLGFCSLPSPYDDKYAVYPPGAYLIFRPLVSLGAAQGVLVMVLFTVYGSFALQNYLLGLFLKRSVFRVLLAMTLTVLCFPLWICLDRGNTELIVGLLIGFSLVLLRQRHLAASVALLTVAICLKLYPIFLLLLFFRKGHLRYMVASIFAAALFSGISFLTFAHSPVENYHLWKANFAFYNQDYLIANDGLGGTASLWNFLKIIFLTIQHVGGKAVQANPAVFLSRLLPVYQAVYLAISAGVAFHVVFIERKLFRRALLLLIFTATAAPSGGDYKLIFIQLGLFLLVAIRERRPHDLAVIVLLALSLVPKKEILLTYLGVSDTGFRDVNIGGLLNPICILTAAGLLIHDGWRLRLSGWGLRRWQGLTFPLRKLIG